MENKKEVRITGMLGFAMRARKLIVGTELVCRAMAGKGVKLVVISQGASDATRKKLKTKSEYYGIPFIEVEMDTVHLGNVIGKSTAVAGVAVCDDGFAKELIKAYQQ